MLEDLQVKFSELLEEKENLENAVYSFTILDCWYRRWERFLLSEIEKNWDHDASNCIIKYKEQGITEKDESLDGQILRILYEADENQEGEEMEWDVYYVWFFVYLQVKILSPKKSFSYEKVW